MKKSADGTLGIILSKINELKRPFVWLMFITLVISSFLVSYDPNLFKSAGLAFLFSLLLLILEIHKKIFKEQRNRYYSSLFDAWPDIHREVIKAIGQRGQSELYWMGVTGNDAWRQLSQILRPLAQSRKISNLTVGITQTDPIFLKEILGDDHALSSQTKGTWKSTSLFCTEFEEEMAAMNFIIKRKRYSYMPNFHGLLINNSILFLSHVRWDGNSLMVPEEPYEYYDTTTEEGRYKINLFISWLERGDAWEVP